MKPESLKAIKNIAEVAMTCTDDNFAGFLKKELERIVRIETPTSKNSKFDMFKYAGKPTGLHPVMQGIFHNAGVKVASDCRILIVKQEDYPEEFEGKIINKAGEFVEGRYPKYMDVIPDLKKHPEAKEHAIDFEKLKEFYAQAKAYSKLNGLGSTVLFNVRLGEQYFDLAAFVLLADFMKEVGASTIWTTEPNRPCVTKQGENVGILMPRMAPADDERVLSFE